MIDAALLILLIAATLITGAKIGARYAQAGHQIDGALARLRRDTDISDAADDADEASS